MSLKDRFWKWIFDNILPLLAEYVSVKLKHSEDKLVLYSTQKICETVFHSEQLLTKRIDGVSNANEQALSEFHKKLEVAIKERDSLRVEIDEISAMQKRELRQFVFERFQGCLGMVNVEVHFDLEKGLIVQHGKVGDMAEIVVFPTYRKYYSQDEIVQIIQTTNELVRQYQKLPSMN